MSYVFMRPLMRNGYYFIHSDTVKELEYQQNCSFAEICEKINVSIIAIYQPLSLIQIKYNGTKQQQPATTPKKSNVQRARVRKRIANNRFVGV